MPDPNLERRAADAIAAVIIKAIEPRPELIHPKSLSGFSWQIEDRHGSLPVVARWGLCDSLNDGQAHRLFRVCLGVAGLHDFLCSFVTLITVDAWQDHMLPIGITFDIVFDQLEWAIYGAAAASLIAAAVMVFVQAGRFSLVERAGLSCAAEGLILIIIATTNIVH